MLQNSHGSTQMSSEESWVAGESSPQWDAPQRKELSRWGLISQKQCQIEQKAKHTEVLDVLATICASREALSRTTVEESHHLVALVIIWEKLQWLRRREGGRLKFPRTYWYSLLPQRVLLRRDKMPNAPLFHSFECLSLFLQTTC